mgnify:FL=1
MPPTYQIVDLTPGADPRDSLPSGLALPAGTLAAAQKAQGALLRTLFTAAGPEGTAALLGYRRPHTAQLKLCALDGDSSLFDQLLHHASQETQKLGLDVKTELGDASQHPIVAPHAVHPANYHQTTEFTCGPVAVLDALLRKGVVERITRDEEIALWREATMAVACDPYGLALACKRRGFTPSVYVSRTGCILDPASDIGILNKALARDTQLSFEQQANEEGIPTRVGDFDSSDIARFLDEGRIVVLLIDEWHWHAERCPHWITVTGRRNMRFYLDDPWHDREYGESVIDTGNLAIDKNDLDLVSSYDGTKAMLVF